jgi:hypothetical protein
MEVTAIGPGYDNAFDIVQEANWFFEGVVFRRANRSSRIHVSVILLSNPFPLP